MSAVQPGAILVVANRRLVRGVVMRPDGVGDAVRLWQWNLVPADRTMMGKGWVQSIFMMPR